jgi:N,N'-diacetylchitobiose phosphorylase
MSTPPYSDPNAAPATLHRLSNGRYEVLISDTGSGVSSCDGLALTRWHADPVEDDLGTIVYLRDLDAGDFWSLGFQSTRAPAGRYRSVFEEGHRVAQRLAARAPHRGDQLSGGGSLPGRRR